MKEKCQPNAFAFAFMADKIHSIVPVAGAHERESMCSEFKTVLNSLDAMIVKCSRDIGVARQVVIRFFIGVERTTLEETDLFVKNTRVGSDGNITARRQRQPEKIVRAAGTNTAIAGRMPPMLHVAFTELMRRAAQQMFA